MQRLAVQIFLNDLTFELHAVGSMSHWLFSKSQTHGQSLWSHLSDPRGPLQYGVPFARRLTGYTPYIEQVDAQRALLGVELSLVQVRTDELTTLVGLYEALGGVPE